MTVSLIKPPATLRPVRSIAPPRRRSIRRPPLILMITACIWCASFSVGNAKLPPPTPEQAANATAEAEKSKALAAEQQAALTRAQDRIVSQYQKDLKIRGVVPPAPTPAGQTSQENLPKAAVEPPRGTAPHGGTTQSAESHSGNAK
jgi:hypothetical protein